MLSPLGYLPILYHFGVEQTAFSHNLMDNVDLAILNTVEQEIILNSIDTTEIDTIRSKLF
jgi:hypothetical protein